MEGVTDHIHCHLNLHKYRISNILADLPPPPLHTLIIYAFGGFGWHGGSGTIACNITPHSLDINYIGTTSHSPIRHLQLIHGMVGWEYNFIFAVKPTQVDDLHQLSGRTAINMKTERFASVLSKITAAVPVKNTNIKLFSFYDVQIVIPMCQTNLLSK